MKQKIYNITVFILCVVSVTFAILDFSKGLTPVQARIDNTVYWLFVVDYIVRFAIAKKKKAFFKENVLDLIAIIPVNSAFRVFRMLKLSKLLRFSKFTKLAKLFRIGSVSARMMVKVKRFLNTNGFIYVLMLSGTFVIAGTLGMMYFEQMSFSDALWWSFVTASTVGYGDLSPGTTAGRVIACVLMIVGIGMIGSLTSTITSFFLHRAEDSKKPRADKAETTAAAEPCSPKIRADEMDELVNSLMRDDPDSFRVRLISTLLRLDPRSEQWKMLEDICKSVAAEDKADAED